MTPLAQGIRLQLLYRTQYQVRRMAGSTKRGPEQAKLLERRAVTDTSEFKWIGLEKLKYADPLGRERDWEGAVRTTRASTGVDGVGILAIVREPGQPDRILLQKQFRPPVGGVCIEMPAGLIDEGETLEEAVARELREETGYSGRIVTTSAILFNDPGFTNTNLRMVTVEIDATAPENRNPQPELEDDEFIECFMVPLRDFPEEMGRLDAAGYKLDARVDNVAHGIKIARMYGL
ncbi:ADL342Wp [Eremothecium gossypii ATCC 10895]|uniref:ADL342Wp n=1 Tax=Eremothecium gossypii (strain ATCC 10895 / CBS 109.51 / FGSC 9923 / NRRL Y-1056) TaxID=284811 RepID=Q75BA9_EREGS|nr:ADL342Wp [Eremothecium gossypii ATCC 10895]AAS51577.1 ADL342Wp [Eremothecium gossypii ATCC 10895]AEY95874.1 FADL342Wp [Eremothecium gossypii FDAG1]